MTPLNRKDWDRVVSLRKLHGAPGNSVRFSITTMGFDSRGRHRRFVVTVAGPYPGGLSDPIFFDDFLDLECFLSEPLTTGMLETLKNQEKRKASVTVLPTKVRRTRRRKAA